MKISWKNYFLVICCVAWALPAVCGELPPLDGMLEPDELVKFSSQVPGIIEQINVKRGDWVKKGQVLASLKSGEAKAAVDLAQARVDFGQRKAQRNEELYKKKLISIHQKDEMETEIQLAQLELAEAKERLKLRTIESTTDGVVVEKIGSAGEYVGEDPFLIVARINPLNVEVVVPVYYFGAIRTGQHASVIIEKPVGGKYKADVFIVDRIIDAASGTFRVRLQLPNPELELPSGLRCKVIFKN